MNKYKVAGFVGFVGLAVLISMTFVTASYLQGLQISNTKVETKSCGAVIVGLQFCTTTPKIVINSGGVVVLKFSVTNVSDHEIEVTSRDLSVYGFKVTDADGNIQLTKFENKIRTNSMTPEDERDFANSTSFNHRSQPLKSKEVLNEKIILSNTYDFSSAGNYFISVTRIIRDPVTEELIRMPLDKIEVEVK